MKYLLLLGFIFSLNIFSNEVKDFMLHCEDSPYFDDVFYLDYDSSNQILIAVISIVNDRSIGLGDDFMHHYELTEANEKDITFKMVLDKRKTKWEKSIPSSLKLNRSSLILDTGREKRSWEPKVECKFIEQQDIFSHIDYIKDLMIENKIYQEKRKKEKEEEARNKI